MYRYLKCLPFNKANVLVNTLNDMNAEILAFLQQIKHCGTDRQADKRKEREFEREREREKQRERKREGERERERYKQKILGQWI